VFNIYIHSKGVLKEVRDQGGTKASFLQWNSCGQPTVGGGSSQRDLAGQLTCRSGLEAID